jgi:hypothetical protein
LRGYRFAAGIIKAPIDRGNTLKEKTTNEIITAGVVEMHNLSDDRYKLIDGDIK